MYSLVTRICLALRYVMNVHLAAFILVLSVIGASGCAAPNSDGPVNKPVAWVLSENLCEPETVLLDQELKRLVVSNICGFKKNGEGYLSLVGLDGTMQEARWLTGFNAPAGMAQQGRTLYVVDIDRVHRIDLTTGERLGIIGPFADAKAFNDIAIDDNGVVYVTDSAQGYVLKIVDGQAEPFPSAETEFKFANGLHFEGGTLYVGGEKFWAVDMDSLAVRPIEHDGVADVDGIESDGKGGLTVSIVGGNVWHLPKGGGAIEWTAQDLSSTNHAHLPEQNLVVVPTGYDNTLIAFRP